MDTSGDVEGHGHAILTALQQVPRPDVLSAQNSLVFNLQLVHDGSVPRGPRHDDHDAYVDPPKFDKQ